MNKSNVGILMDKVGPVGHWADFTKEEQQLLKQMETDGIVNIYKRGRGKATLVYLTEKAKVVQSIVNK